MSATTHCSYCQRGFDTLLAKKVHEQHVHIFVFKCDFCETKFQSERNMSKHMNKCIEKPQSRKGPSKDGDVDNKLRKYEERKRKADSQVEQYAELLKDMKNKAARKDVAGNRFVKKKSVDTPENQPKSELELKKLFLEKVLKEAKNIAQSQAGFQESIKLPNSTAADKEKVFQKLLQKFEDCRTSKATSDILAKTVNTPLRKSVEHEDVQIRKKPSKAVVAFECSFCDSLFKSKETLVKHEEGHESQDNSEDEDKKFSVSELTEVKNEFSVFKESEGKAKLLPEILKREEVLKVQSTTLEYASSMKYKEALRKAQLLPEIENREKLLQRKLVGLKQVAIAKQKAEMKQKRIEIVQAAMKKKQQVSDPIASYEYQHMLEKAKNLESKKEEHNRLKLKLDRVKKQVKNKMHTKQQNAILAQNTAVSKLMSAREDKLKPIQAFEKSEKKSIKAEPSSPEKYESPEMDPDFQVKLEPEISIKEEPGEYDPESLSTLVDSNQTSSSMKELSQAEKLEKYRALKARLQQLTAKKEADMQKNAGQRVTDLKPSIVDRGEFEKREAVTMAGGVGAVPSDTVVNSDTARGETLSIADKKLKARLAREDTVREVHKRIEERKKAKEEEELDKSEQKAKELLIEVRHEVKTVTEELEEFDLKQRKKSRKELRKHLQGKIVQPVAKEFEHTTATTSESKMERIREMEEEREKLQQKLDEMKLKRHSLKETRRISKRRSCDEVQEVIAKSRKIEDESRNSLVMDIIDNPSKVKDGTTLTSDKNKELNFVAEEEKNRATDMSNEYPSMNTEKANTTEFNEDIVNDIKSTINVVEADSFLIKAETCSAKHNFEETTGLSLVEETKSAETKAVDSECIAMLETSSSTATLEGIKVLETVSIEPRIEKLNEQIIEDAANPAIEYREEDEDCHEMSEKENSVGSDIDQVAFKFGTENNAVTSEDSEESDNEENALDINYDEYESDVEDEDIENDVLEVTGEDEKQWKKVEIKKGSILCGVEETILVPDTPIIIDDIDISDDSEDDDDPELQHYISSRNNSRVDVKHNDTDRKLDVSLEEEDDDEILNDAEEIDDLHLLIEEEASSELNNLVGGSAPSNEGLKSDEQSCHIPPCFPENLARSDEEGSPKEQTKITEVNTAEDKDDIDQNNVKLVLVGTIDEKKKQREVGLLWEEDDLKENEEVLSLQEKVFPRQNETTALLHLAGQVSDIEVELVSLHKEVETMVVCHQKEEVAVSLQVEAASSCREMEVKLRKEEIDNCWNEDLAVHLWGEKAVCMQEETATILPNEKGSVSMQKMGVAEGIESDRTQKDKAIGQKDVEIDNQEIDVADMGLPDLVMVNREIDEVTLKLQANEVELNVDDTDIVVGIIDGILLNMREEGVFKEEVTVNEQERIKNIEEQVMTVAIQEEEFVNIQKVIVKINFENEMIQEEELAVCMLEEGAVGIQEEQVVVCTIEEAVIIQDKGVIGSTQEKVAVRVPEEGVYEEEVTTTNEEELVNIMEEEMADNIGDEMTSTQEEELTFSILEGRLAGIQEEVVSRDVASIQKKVVVNIQEENTNDLEEGVSIVIKEEKVREKIVAESPQEKRLVKLQDEEFVNIKEQKANNQEKLIAVSNQVEGVEDIQDAVQEVMTCIHEAEVAVVIQIEGVHEEVITVSTPKERFVNFQNEMEMEAVCIQEEKEEAMFNIQEKDVVGIQEEVVGKHQEDEVEFRIQDETKSLAVGSDHDYIELNSNDIAIKSGENAVSASAESNHDGKDAEYNNDESSRSDDDEIEIEKGEIEISSEDSSASDSEEYESYSDERKEEEITEAIYADEEITAPILEKTEVFEFLVEKDKPVTGAVIKEHQGIVITNGGCFSIGVLNKGTIKGECASIHNQIDNVTADIHEEEILKDNCLVETIHNKETYDKNTYGVISCDIGEEMKHTDSEDEGSDTYTDDEGEEEVDTDITMQQEEIEASIQEKENFNYKNKAEFHSNEQEATKCDESEAKIYDEESDTSDEGSNDDEESKSDNDEEDFVSVEEEEVSVPMQQEQGIVPEESLVEVELKDNRYQDVAKPDIETREEGDFEADEDEYEADMDEDELWEEEYDETWEDENEDELVGALMQVKTDGQNLSSDKPLDATGIENSVDVDGSDTDDEEEWITLDSAQNILADIPRTNIGLDKTADAASEVIIPKRKSESESDNSSESDSSTDGESSDSESGSSGSEPDEVGETIATKEQIVFTNSLENNEEFDDEVTYSDIEDKDKDVASSSFIDILDHTWKDAHKFENIFSSDDNGEEILKMFYTGSLSKEKLLQVLPSLGWIGRNDAEFLPSGWLMKMTNGSLDDTGPILYTFITDTASICESAFDAIEHMNSKGYRSEAVEAFENYCTNFTELSTSLMSDQSSRNMEAKGFDDSDDDYFSSSKENLESKNTEFKACKIGSTVELSDSEEELVGTVNIMDEDALSDSDDDFNEDKMSASKPNNSDGCSFDDVLSDSDDDFEEVMEME